jgi:hypothetical protein
MSLRTWFCVTAALVAAALANPLVEFVSNGGLFGACGCTDRSNVDVLPTISVGLLAGLSYLYLRVQHAFARDARPVSLNLPRLIPAIFALQILVLFTMETLEQIVVRGHALSGTTWLGGPLPISLAVHAATCLIATLLLARVLGAITRTAVRIVGLILRSSVVPARGPRKMFARFRYPASFRRPGPLRCRIGERAPPRLTA